MPVPFVWTVTVAGRASRLSVEEACAVTVPAVGEVNVIVHCPAAFGVRTGVVQVPVGVGVASAPFESVSVTSTCSPAAGTNVPVPVSFSSVTVNVCGWPTSFVASGAIEILRVDERLDRVAAVQQRRGRSAP